MTFVFTSNSIEDETGTSLQLFYMIVHIYSNNLAIYNIAEVFTPKMVPVYIKQLFRTKGLINIKVQTNALLYMTLCRLINPELGILSIHNIVYQYQWQNFTLGLAPKWDSCTSDSGCFIYVPGESKGKKFDTIMILFRGILVMQAARCTHFRFPTLEPMGDYITDCRYFMCLAIA